MDLAFVSVGYNNWKKALENGRGFRKHNDSKSHAFAFKAYQTFITGKPVDTQLSEEADREVSLRQETIRRNRLTIGRIFNVIRFIARMALPFRGHDESDTSENRGLFLKLITYLANNGDNILAGHLNDAAGNAKYLSSTSQNEMIEIIGEEIQNAIVLRAKAAVVFSVMMDETTDVSHKEQVSIFIRFLTENDGDLVIEERLLSIVDTACTGEALAKLLTECLTKHGLRIEDVVGQGYDGGSNMRGAQKGVQARIKMLNPNALFTYCFAQT